MGNVDLKCAVKLSALSGKSLPMRRMRMLEDRAIGTDLVLLDRCGRVRSSATMSMARRGKKPANFGKKYPAQPLTPRELMALLDACGKSPAHVRLRALIALMYRAGLRISEALDLFEHDLDREAHTVFVACGKGGKARSVSLDPWAFEQIDPWLELRPRYPYGPLFCICEGPTRGERMSSPWVRTTLKRLAAECGIRKNVRPHQLRHSMAVAWVDANVNVALLQRQLGHSSLGTTSTYVSGLPGGAVVMAGLSVPAPDAIALGRRD